jgi:hypothetical protein
MNFQQNGRAPARQPPRLGLRADPKLVFLSEHSRVHALVQGGQVRVACAPDDVRVEHGVGGDPRRRAAGGTGQPLEAALQVRGPAPLRGVHRAQRFQPQPQFGKIAEWPARAQAELA